MNVFLNITTIGGREIATRRSVSKKVMMYEETRILFPNMDSLSLSAVRLYSSTEVRGRVKPLSSPLAHIIASSPLPANLASALNCNQTKV